MLITPIIDYSGDKVKCLTWLGFARGKLNALVASMAKANLDQNSGTIYPVPGVVVNFSKSFNITRINISVSDNVIEEIETFYRWFWYALSISTEESLSVAGANNLLINIALSGSGDVYVVGSSMTREDPDVNNLNQEPIIIKYDEDGVFQWRRVIRGRIVSGAGHYDNGTAIAVSNAAVYSTYDIWTSRFTSNYDVVIGKHSFGGTLTWEQLITSPEDITAFARGCTTDINGNIIVVGRWYYYNMDGSPINRYNTFIVKFASDGSVVWKKIIGDAVVGSEVTSFEQVVTDADGNIYTVGHHYGTYTSPADSTLYPDGLLVKFDSNGNILWKKAMRGETVQNDGNRNHYDDGVKCSDVNLDSDGNIYVIAGTVIGSIDYCHTNIFKFNSSGTLQWHQVADVSIGTISNPALGTTFAAEIACGASGVYITFCRYPDTTTDPDTFMGAYVVKLQKDTGTISYKKLLALDTDFEDFVGSEGLFPRGILTDDESLYFAFDAYEEDVTVTAKLPIELTEGKLKDITIEDASEMFSMYDDIENVPYREESDGTGHYEMFIRDDFPMTVLSASTINDEMTISDWAASGGDYSSELWEKTNKILETKHIKEGSD